MEQFGKYALLRRLAYGGMAEIFLARLEGEEGFRKTCVLKRILPQFSADDDFVRMFVDEAVLAARLSHPNVVQTYDFGNVDGSYFIAMELIEGTDLRKLTQAAVKRARSLSPAEVAALGEEISRGLSYVHNLRDERGEHLTIVHRDISPHNIMVSRAGQAKIMDFGIAKAALRAVKTRTGTIKGKLAYMSPEQAAAERVDHRTDQFAVGLVLWELITGMRHFDGSSEPELLGKVMRGDIRDPRELRPDTPAPLVEVVERMLQKAPGDRYPDLADAEQALAQFRFSLGPSAAVRLGQLVDDLAPPLDLRPDPALAEVGSGSKRSGTKALPPPTTPPTEGGDTGWSDPVARTETRPPSSADAVSEVSGETVLLPDPLVDSVDSSPQSATVALRQSPWLAIAAVALLVLVGGALLAGLTKAPSESDGADNAEPVRSGPHAGEVDVEVSVDSVPDGAAILIDGKETGLRTPTTLRGLERGVALAIELRRRGFEPGIATVVLEEPKEQLRLELTPIAAGARETSAAPMPGAEGTEREGATMTLSVSSKPSGGAVTLNGRSVGRTPVQLTELEPGARAELLVEKRGYRPWRRSITLDEAHPKVVARLEPLRAAPSKPAPRVRMGELSIRTDGPWVRVFHRGRLLGNTPLNRYELPAGPVKLELRRPEEDRVFRALQVTIPAGGHVGKTVITR